MDVATQIEAMRALYRQPDADDLRRQLPDLADTVHAQLMTLHAMPCESGCESLTNTLHGIRAHVLQLADAIHREVSE
ncbi:MAG: hypothetical protein QM599_01830 [Pseudoxanthomonas sp.]